MVLPSSAENFLERRLTMKNMLSEALCAIRGLLNQLLVNLEGEQGEEWLYEFKKFLRKERCWVKGSILEFLNNSTVIIPAGKHNVAELFKIGTHEDGVVISGWWGNFGKWCGQAVEEFTEKTKLNLRLHALKQSSSDALIIAGLGRAENVAVPLVAIRNLLKRQPKNKVLVAYWEDESIQPEDKPLEFINAVGKKVVLRTVYVRWDGGGWLVSSSSIALPSEWYAGGQVLSRNS